MKPDFPCTLADVGNICAASEEGKTEAETAACEHELNRYCEEEDMQEPVCSQCIEQHLQRLDSPPLLLNTKCSSFQLENYCAFKGSKRNGQPAGKSAPDGLGCWTFGKKHAQALR